MIATDDAAPVWRSEINADNPLGMSGKVAEQFGALMGELWSNRSGSSVSPTDFKRMIGKFRPMFLGWSQQDSQELLAFLLDGLHEDLNRIKQKPSYETPDFHTGTDAEMVAHANKSWAQYKTRNDSVIVDLFQGQYRNTMECLECGQVSVKCVDVPMIPAEPAGLTRSCTLPSRCPRCPGGSTSGGSRSIRPASASSRSRSRPTRRCATSRRAWPRS